MRERRKSEDEAGGTGKGLAQVCQWGQGDSENETRDVSIQPLSIIIFSSFMPVIYVFKRKRLDDSSLTSSAEMQQDLAVICGPKVMSWVVYSMCMKMLPCFIICVVFRIWEN